MARYFIIPCFNRIFVCATVGFIINTIVGCASTSTASYLDRAERATDCSEAAYYYRTAILSAKNENNLNTNYVDKAIVGVRETISSCSTNPAKVIEESKDAASYLAEYRPKDAIEIANLLVDYIEHHPHAYVVNLFNLVKLAKDNSEAKLWARFYGISIDRGIWYPKDMFWVNSNTYGMPEDQAAFLPQLEGLRGALQAASDRAAAATTMKCDLKYCDLPNGMTSSEHEQLVVYQRAYAAELVRLGFGDSNRVAIVNGLADATTRRLNAERARRERSVAQAAAEHRANPSALSMLGALAQGAAIAGGKNAPQLQVLGSALQGSPTSGIARTGAAQYNASGSSEKISQKNCGTISSLSSAKQVCSCEGGKPEQLQEKSRTNVICNKPEPWTCSFPYDGSRHRCAVR